MNNEILKNMHVKKYPAATNYKLSESEQNEIQKLLPVYEEPIKNSKNLNTILYGPPGTGKTYNTVNHALSIIESKSLSEIQGEEKINGRKALKSRFDDYKEQ
jgi:5-methylcytosine-specific restriction protein B